MKKILSILVVAAVMAMAMPAQSDESVFHPPQLQISADEPSGKFHSVNFFQIKGCKDYFQSFRLYQPDENYLFRNQMRMQMRMQLIIFTVRTDTKKEFSIGFYPKGLLVSFLFF